MINMANAMTKLKKTEFIPFLDTSDSGSSSEVWSRIDKSTIFALNANAQTEDYDYICNELPVTEVKNYLPELPQEIALYEGNPVYDFVSDMFYELPVGAECIKAVLICFGGTGNKAWRTDATIVLQELNTVDGKLTFTIKFSGNIERGTYTITSGKPTFTARTSTTQSEE